MLLLFFFSSRRRHTRLQGDWSSDVCSSDLLPVDDGEVTFRFPLVIAPRYMPGRALAGDQAGLGTAADTDLVPDASRIRSEERRVGKECGSRGAAQDDRDTEGTQDEAALSRN